MAVMKVNKPQIILFLGLNSAIGLSILYLIDKIIKKRLFKFILSMWLFIISLICILTFIDIKWLKFILFGCNSGSWIGFLISFRKNSNNAK
jgi:hypothetical protein